MEKKNKYLYPQGESLAEFPPRDIEREKIIANKVAKELCVRLTPERIDQLVLDLSTENFPQIRQLLQNSNYQFSEEERSVDPMLLKKELREWTDEKRKYKEKLLSTIRERITSQAG